MPTSASRPRTGCENIRRVAEVAALMADAGFIIITAFISPYRSDRRRAREIALEGGCDFIEVFVNTPAGRLRAARPEELYKKARAGEIKDFTGVDAPYEAPEGAEIVVRTEDATLEESVARILEVLLARAKGDEEHSPSI